MSSVNTENAGTRSRWLLSGLAGAVTLATGMEAYAVIVAATPPPNLPAAASPGSTPATGVQNWDINGDLVTDLQFSFRNPQSATQLRWQANVWRPSTVSPNGVVGFTGPYFRYATNHAAGVLIGPGSAFQPTGTNTQVAMGSVYAGLPYGGFTSGSVPGNPGGGQAAQPSGYLGFRFNIGTNTHYGWVHVTVTPSTTAAGSGGIFFGDAAYETTPNTAIEAGMIPEPSSIAGLAMGAAALLIRRRQRA